MKADIKFDPKSLMQLKEKFKQLQDLSSQELSNELARFGFDARNKMVQKINVQAVDTGQLKGSINVDVRNKQVRLWSDKKYAPYVEFGTGRKYSGVELDRLGIDRSYSAQFKGKSQDRVHLPARPYFFNSVREELKDLMVRLENRIDKLTKK